MNKFLKLVEENDPEKDIDALTDAKRSLQRFLMKRDIRTTAKAWEESLSIELDDGRVVELEVKDVRHPVEDQEGELTADAAIEAAGATNPESPVGKAVTDRKKKIEAYLPKYTQATGQIK